MDGSSEGVPDSVYYYFVHVSLPIGSPLERTGYIHLMRGGNR